MRRTRKRDGEKPVKFLKKLERETVSEIAEVKVNKQEVEMAEVDRRGGGRGTAGPSVGAQQSKCITWLRRLTCLSFVRVKRQRRRLDTIQSRRSGWTA